jgi:hypothetical protein
MGENFEWPRNSSTAGPEAEQQPQSGEKPKRPPRPRLDTIMSAPSTASTQEPSEETPRPSKSSPPEGLHHDYHQATRNGAAQSSSRQNQGPSGVSTQINNPLLSPIVRRARRKSIFEPRFLPNQHLEAPTSALPAPNFTSPLAQLFSPIITEPPDGGFNAPTTMIGQRRASRSGGDPQLAPGVALFRRKALSGILGTQGMGSSALSTTPREDVSKEPSETVSYVKKRQNWGLIFHCLGWAAGGR